MKTEIILTEQTMNLISEKTGISIAELDNMLAASQRGGGKITFHFQWWLTRE